MRANTLIESIVSKKTPCLFVSPHLDDAVLSAGDLISYLADKTEVKVVTVFTEPSPKPYTLSAKSFLRQCGYGGRAEELFAERRKEDKEIFSRIGVEAIHLGFIDATWRKKETISFPRKIAAHFIPELGHRYPVHQLNVISGKIVKEDFLLIDEIGASVRKIAGDWKDYAVFSPVSFGNHVDHTLTREMSGRFFSNAILWSDFPYNLESKTIMPKGCAPMQWSKNMEKKKELINGYRTQVNAMFPGGIPLIPEIYYISVN